ncbi:hypothetical protein M0R88_06365 [Halorussus gelatinilyticus]|uniref:Uncharacterized protein n=1 Tax=Halorussus gelatinilyticus TaxID=2937524 RepID=A0A8U0IMR7_9EURY|nr:hypothetical protein [Halorussus gelatinilyticus]UPW01722.1 hypothetical protein M0R88_06365 [Halorussus gelatinilyticus]
MGNTVRTFSSLGTSEPSDEEQEGLGDSLANIDTEPKLEYLLIGMFEEVNVDSVESVRELREDTRAKDYS